MKLGKTIVKSCFACLIANAMPYMDLCENLFGELAEVSRSNRRYYIFFQAFFFKFGEPERNFWKIKTKGTANFVMD